MDGFGARQKALEGGYYRQEELRILQRRAEKLRAEGRLPSAIVSTSSEGLAAASSQYTSVLDLPTSVSGRRACEVPYAHTPSILPGIHSTKLSELITA